MPRAPVSIPLLLLTVAFSASWAESQPPSPEQPSRDRTLRIQAEPDFRKGLTRLAVVPIDCPPKLDCPAVEKELAADLRRITSLEVVEAAEVAEVLQSLNIRDLQHYDLRRVNHRLRDRGREADAFVVAALEAAGGGSRLTSPWVSHRAGGVGLSLRPRESAVGLSLFTPRGDVLLEGQAAGKSGLRSKASLCAKQFQRILRAAWEP